MDSSFFGRGFMATIQILAFIGLSVATLLTSAAAVAQTPTLIQNVDEPARNPYQQTLVSSDCNSGGCGIVFEKVPANMTLRITYVSCFFTVGDANGVGEVYVTNGDEKTAFISTVAYGNPSNLVANANINLYAAAGKKPVAGVQAWTGAISTFSCTLSGYYVTL
jgi:hypothetical protein